MSSDEMPKLDASKDFANLSATQRNYIKFLEKQNAERAAKVLKMRRNNIRVGCFLGLGVLAIYGYSIFSVKQERFLEDLDE